MAKNDGTSGGEQPANGSTRKLTVQAVASLLKGEVTIPVLDKDGKPVFITDPDGSARRYKTETRPIEAAHLIGFRVAGDQVVATTIDGQKLTAPLR